MPNLPPKFCVTCTYFQLDSLLKSIFDSIVIVKYVSRSEAQQLQDLLTNTEPKVKHPRCVFYIFQLQKNRFHSQMFAQVVLPCGFPLLISFRWTFSEHTGVARPKRDNVIQTSHVDPGCFCLLFYCTKWEINKTDFVSIYSTVFCFGN